MLRACQPSEPPNDLPKAVAVSFLPSFPKGPCRYMGILGLESIYMVTPLGPKYVPYTYMDPLGFKVWGLGFRVRVPAAKKHILAGN